VAQGSIEGEKSLRVGANSQFQSLGSTLRFAGGVAFEGTVRVTGNTVIESNAIDFARDRAVSGVTSSFPVPLLTLRPLTPSVPISIGGAPQGNTLVLHSDSLTALGLDKTLRFDLDIGYARGGGGAVTVNEDLSITGVLGLYGSKLTTVNPSSKLEGLMVDLRFAGDVEIGQVFAGMGVVCGLERGSRAAGGRDFGLFLEEVGIEARGLFQVGGRRGGGLESDFFLGEFDGLRREAPGIFSVRFRCEQAGVDFHPLEVEGAGDDFFVEGIAHRLHGDVF
jgi:hypothetical protein